MRQQHKRIERRAQSNCVKLNGALCTVLQLTAATDDDDDEREKGWKCNVAMQCDITIRIRFEKKEKENNNIIIVKTSSLVASLRDLILAHKD